MLQLAMRLLSAPGSRPTSLLRRAAICLALVSLALPAAAEPPRVALVLSGGSALGFAHVGVIQALDEAGIEADMVVGTSMGSIVGAMYACGFDAQMMRDVIAQADWAAFFSDARDRRSLIASERPLAGGHLLETTFSRQGISLLSGLIDGRLILQYYYRTLGEFAAVYDFDELPVPYRAVTADLETGELVVIGSGSLAQAMRASSAIPGVFTPLDLNGQWLVDGGVIANLPVDVARDMGADYIIAVDVAAVAGISRDDPVQLSAIDRSIRMLMEAASRANRPHADVTIEPDLSRFVPYEFGRWDEIVDAGVAAGREAISRIDLEPGPVDRGSDPPVPFEPQTLSGIEVTGVPDAVILPVLTRAGVRPGEPADVSDITRAVDDVYATTNVELAHYALIPAAEGVVLRITARPTDPGTLRLGLTYRERLLGEAPASVSVRGDVVIDGITTPRSRWWTHVALIDGTSIRSEFRQPLGIPAAATVALEAANTHRYCTAAPPVRVYTVRSLGGQATLCAGPPRGARLSAGLAAQWVTVDPWFDSEEAYQGWFVGPRAGVHWDNRDRPAATQRGSLMRISCRSSLPPLGASATFHALEGVYHQWVPVSDAITIAARISGLTDFPALESGPLPLHEQHRFGGLSTFVGLPEESMLVSEFASLRGSADAEIMTFVPEVGGGLLLTGLGDLAFVRESDTYRFRWGVAGGLKVVTNLVSGTFVVGYGERPVVYLQLESSSP